MAIISEESQVFSDHKEWSSYQVLDNQLADETTSDEVDVRNASAVTLFVETGSVVSGGVVKLETAATTSGPWFVAGSVTTSASNTGYAVTLSGGDDGLPARYARARIETVIAGGGSVDAYIIIQR